MIRFEELTGGGVSVKSGQQRASRAANGNVCVSTRRFASSATQPHAPGTCISHAPARRTRASDASAVARSQRPAFGTRARSIPRESTFNACYSARAWRTQAAGYSISRNGTASSGRAMRSRAFEHNGARSFFPTRGSVATNIPSDTTISLFQTAGYFVLQVGPALGNGDGQYALHDTLTMHSALQLPKLGMPLHDVLAIRASANRMASLHVAIADTLSLADDVAPLFTARLLDALTLTDSTAMSLELAALVDALVLMDSARSTLAAYHRLADALVLVDAVHDARIQRMTDQLQLQDTLANRVAAKLAMLDALTFDDAAASTLTIHCLVADTLTLGDSGAPSVDCVVALVDALGISIRVRTDEGVTVAYAMNTATKGASRYINYPFNSFAEINGRLLGCADDGLYAIEGDTDDGVPIEARVRTGLDAFGTTQLKRMFKAYLGYRSNGDVLLRVITTGPQGQKVENTYKAIGVTADVVRNGKVPIGKGLKSVYWQFEVANVDGVEFLLDTLSVIPLVSGRRFE